MARAVVYMRQHWSRDLKEAGKRATRVSPEAANRPWGGSVNPESGACQVTARGGRDASVRHPTRCHSQHGQLSGGLQRGSRQSEVGTAQGSGRFPVEPRAGLWRPRPRPAQRCLGRGRGRWQPRASLGWESHAVGIEPQGCPLLSHFPNCRESTGRARGGRRASMGAREVTLPKLRYGHSATQHGACPAPGRCRNFSQGLRLVLWALRFSDVPSASQKGVHESLCTDEEPRPGGGRVLAPPPSARLSPQSGPRQVLAASN